MHSTTGGIQCGGRPGHSSFQLGWRHQHNSALFNLHFSRRGSISLLYCGHAYSANMNWSALPDIYNVLTDQQGLFWKYQLQLNRLLVKTCVNWEYGNEWEHLWWCEGVRVGWNWGEWAEVRVKWRNTLDLQQTVCWESSPKEYPHAPEQIDVNVSYTHNNKYPPPSLMFQ